MEIVTPGYPLTPLSLTATFKLVFPFPADPAAGPVEDIVWSDCPVRGWRLGHQRTDYGWTLIHFDWHHETLPGDKQLIINTIRSSSDGASTEYLESQIVSTHGPCQLHQLETSSFEKMPFISVVIITSSRFGVDIGPHTCTLSSTLRAELNASLRHGGFVDTLFYVFSCRRAVGGAGLPKALYAKSSMLIEKSKYFKNLLVDNGSTQCTLEGTEGVSRDPQLLFTESYDYESDSDLGDIEEEEDVTKEEVILSEDRPDGRKNSSEHDDKLALENPAISPRVYRTVVVEDSAYITWNALLFYLYTGHIAFSPLTSELKRSRAVYDEQYLKDHPDCPSPCSPKSLYRLADKLGLDDLKQMAFHKIMSSMTPENVAVEYFSSFTSRYEEVRDSELEFMRAHYKSDPAVRAGLRKRSAEMMKGIEDPEELQSLAQTFFDLFHKLML